ncbi:toxin co-regulated pilus biosynthesis Q family protein [Caballeronia sp. J97]|uniref:toxin co-regulated pilus biosynthesis Q family protein n=1 Tax=Caballeronia sp. J97 TaxID=2805429 RepID=UPI002AB02238|nr:toxin co-regulated pilus biosynthesis Q family protein [Caballeronia sp. J97]
MTPIFSLQTHRTARLFAQLFACLALTTVATLAAAADPDQSRIAPPPGDGWQMLSAPAARPAPVQVAMATPATVVAPSAAAGAVPTALPGDATTVSGTVAPKPVIASLDVAAVVVPAAGASTGPGGVLSLTITPQDINLRNALDRWLQQQGWQLAWKIDDDLPLEFNATFSGDFKSVLTQLMQATNHMRTPTRVCKHTNNVIRVVARAANCQE